MSGLSNIKRIVIKVGTSTLTYPTGKANIRQMKKLIAVISDLANSGMEVALVTSGAIGMGAGKLGLSQKPTDTAGKQAAATVGQCELMFIYDKLFGEYGHVVGQFLLTKRDVENTDCRRNIINAFEKNFEFGAIPIINENDSIAIDEIVYGDNDNLSAIVARLIHADVLMILTDTDGLYDSNPKHNADAKVIPVVEKITEQHFEIAGGRGSTLGTGGMITKVQAAKNATDAGIPTVIIHGENPENIYKVLEGQQIGTVFKSRS